MKIHQPDPLDIYYSLPLDRAIRLLRLGRFGDLDAMASFVPERSTHVFALHPCKWEPTFYSLTLKDSKKIRYYQPVIIPIPPGTLCGDMRFINAFDRTDDQAEKRTFIESYRRSLVPYEEANVDDYLLPELLIPRE